MPQPIFITGIGTGVGKTTISAMIAEALHADYWKPVQAGFENGTDSDLVKTLINNQVSQIFPESYKLRMAASPHLSAREENVRIDLNKIQQDFNKHLQISTADHLIIEAAGGLLAPLNEKEFVIDLVEQSNAYVIIVSRNYLGSINHSLLTSQACRQKNIKVLGWIFNDQYLNYQQEIADWSGYPNLYSVPALRQITAAEVLHHARLMKQSILNRFITFDNL